MVSSLLRAIRLRLPHAELKPYKDHAEFVRVVVEQAAPPQQQSLLQALANTISDYDKGTLSSTAFFYRLKDIEYRAVFSRNFNAEYVATAMRIDLSNTMAPAAEINSLCEAIGAMKPAQDGHFHAPRENQAHAAQAPCEQCTTNLDDDLRHVSYMCLGVWNRELEGAKRRVDTLRFLNSTGFLLTGILVILQISSNIGILGTVLAASSSSGTWATLASGSRWLVTSVVTSRILQGMILGTAGAVISCHLGVARSQQQLSEVVYLPDITLSRVLVGAWAGVVAVFLFDLLPLKDVAATPTSVQAMQSLSCIAAGFSERFIPDAVAYSQHRLGVPSAASAGNRT